MQANTLMVMNNTTQQKIGFTECLMQLWMWILIIASSVTMSGCATPYQQLPADEIFIGAQSPGHDWGMTVDRNFPYQVQPWPGLPSSACPTLNNIVDLTPWVKQEVQHVRPY
jgi:hypothetical protein